MSKKINFFIQWKSHATLFALLGADQSAPVGFIVATDCCDWTPLVVNFKAEF
jgi:hypothetical protein